MKYTKLNSKGISAVEGLLLIVIVAIIAVVGWIVVQSQQKANSTLNTANQSTSNTSTQANSSTKTEVAAGARAKVIATGLLAYVKTNANAPLKDYVDKHVNDGQFTSNFKTAVDNGSALVGSGSNNPVYCSATKAPSGFKAVPSSISGDSDVVSLSEIYAGSSTTNPGPQLTLVYGNGTWSVDQYMCP